MSLVEAMTNVAVGFLLAVLTQVTLFPVLGLSVSAADNLLIKEHLHCSLDRAEQ
jgi:hypothetical protein